MRPFLWFSNTVWSILQKFFTSWLRKFAVVAQIQNGAEKGKILLRILGKNIVTIFLLTAVNIDLETLDSWVCYYKETKGQILALNHLVVSNFVLDQLQICKKNRSRSTHLHYCMFPGNSFNTVCFYSKIVAWNTLLGQVQNLTTFITTQYAFFLDAFLPPMWKLLHRWSFFSSQKLSLITKWNSKN